MSGHDAPEPEGPVLEQQNKSAYQMVRKRLFRALTGPPALAFVPAFSLAAFWFGGEGALLVVAAILPVLYLVAGGTVATSARRDVSDKPMSARAFDERVAQVAETSRQHQLEACIHLVFVEELEDLRGHHGAAAAEHVIHQTGMRLRSMLRDEDALADLGQGCFGVCVGPSRQLSLEHCIQVAARLQTVAEDAIAVDGTAIYINATVGFCQLSRSTAGAGAEWLEAARTALSHAQARGPSSIRAYSDQMNKVIRPRRTLREEVEDALESGEIAPWFQPQLSTDTGMVSGFEALARWVHPVRGTLPPAEFLPAIADAGLMERLAEKMIFHSFRALKAWDAAGLKIPCVGVNFTGSELSDPNLVERIKWDLDRFDLGADRLAIEILETVVANSPEDIIARNISALGDLGCRIDLDDFGTGNASFTAIKRFAIGRIKIDRSFVVRADRDPDQQQLVSAILTMAERLDLDTLAEGVETMGEHVLLAQLGCNHVQGFGIARPMPFDQTVAWITAHTAKLQEVPQIAQSRRK
ncbi:GGDEF domain-containing phosphodiesterase [Sulfitobacter sp. HNIBRBA3233]|uniref:putative bifunctional diguanylate cyclase/phosphodiesterase n=1 Tax=Sulfitobacter marinivivus TaxID=3158558 RepID=UPI0032DF6798